MQLNYKINASYLRVRIIIFLKSNTILFYVCSLTVLLFCLVSFQFVVSDSGDYTIHAMDPDVLVEWDLIEQVVSVLPVVFKTFPSDLVNKEKKQAVLEHAYYYGCWSKFAMLVKQTIVSQLVGQSS